MYPIAHLGIGAAVAKTFRFRGISWYNQNLEWFPLLLGTLLPDLIDKPIYYALVLYRGQTGSELGMVAGTRSFGHTLLFLIFILTASILVKSSKGIALTWGVATHQFLDVISDIILNHRVTALTFRAFLWPFMGLQFPVTPYQNLGEQVAHWLNREELIGESIGILILLFILILGRRIYAKIKTRF